VAILRKKHKEQYTVIPQGIFKDKRLSLKDIGLLTCMLSLPDNWQFSIKGLDAIFPNDGQSSIRAALTNLEQFGYLSRERERKGGKLGGVIWTLYDTPQVVSPRVENPHVENPHVEKPHVENQLQSNTKQSTTNQSIKKEDIYPFEEFWKAYPKKKAKEDARKAWNKLKPNEALGKEIIQAVTESAKSKDWLKENGKYIPYPATYLNGKRWEDERNETNGQDTGNPRKVQYGTVL
jgi:hypothetical protein